MFYNINEKRNLPFRLGFLGVGVTIVYVLQQLSAGAEPERPRRTPTGPLETPPGTLQ